MRSILRVALVPLVMALAACADGPPPVAKPVAHAAPVSAAPACLSIVAWNDLHGQLSADEPVVDTGKVPAGGIVALADQVAAIRATGDAVIVLDAGDLFTGPLASTYAEGAPVIEAENLIGVDAAAIGNHDFDFGPVGNQAVLAAPGVGDEAGAAGPRGALLARMNEATFPFLSANVHMKGGAPPAWPKYRTSVRIARSGFDVGVVGYTTRSTPATTLKPNVLDLDFSTGAAASVARAIRELRAAGSSPIVLLAHASLEGELPKDLGDRAEHHGEIASLMAELDGDTPDLIIAGHRHAWMLGRVRGVPIVSSGQHGIGLSRSRYCRTNGTLKLEGIEQRVAMASTPPHTELGAKVAAAMAPWEAKVQPIADEPVTTIPRECAHRALNGLPMGDQMARACAEHVADAAAPPPGVPVVALVNAGGLRASLRAGPVRFGDVFNAFPFENTVAACGATKRDFVHIIENAIRKESSRERFPFGIAGAKVKLHRGTDGRLTLLSVDIEGAPKNAGDDSPVWLALPDFILFGGDDLLAGVTCAPAATSQTRMRDAWRTVLTREHGGCEGPSKNVLVE